jgi:subtilisin family serine protease
VGPEEVRVVRRFMAVPALAVTVSSQAALSRLAGDDAVVRVDLDVGGGGGLSLSVAQIGATERHARGNDGAGVNVAILDTGVDLGHPALEGRIVHEACFGGAATPFCHNGTNRHVGSGAARDDAGHGTHVVGIMAASGEGSAPGVAPAAGIVAVKVMDNCSFAGCFYAFSELVAALDYLIANQETLNVRAINMSLGTSQRFPGVCDEATAFNMAGAHAVNTLRSLGVVTIASSMNNGSGSEMGSPACLSNVVSVGAVTREDVVPTFSNGNHLTDVLAPGVGITSLARGGGTISAGGTSMAAPHVAGCAALIAQSDPGVTADQLAQRLRTSPVRVTDPKNNLSYPRLSCVDPPPPDPVTTTRVGRPGAS